MSVNITSVWLEICDEGGNKALEVLVFDKPLKDPIGKLRIESFAFYEKGEDGVNHLFESSSPNSQPLITV